MVSSRAMYSPVLTNQKQALESRDHSQPIGEQYFILPDQDVRALLTGPVPGQSLDIVHGAESQQSAHVLLQDEVVVDTARHVSKPHVQGSLAVNLSRQLREHMRLNNVSRTLPEDKQLA